MTAEGRHMSSDPDEFPELTAAASEIAELEAFLDQFGEQAADPATIRRWQREAAEQDAMVRAYRRLTGKAMEDGNP